MPWSSRRASAEEGRITVLVAGLLALVLLAIAVTTGITAVATKSRRLLVVADGAALAATDAVTGSSSSNGGRDVALDAGQARDVVAHYLRRVGAEQEFDELSIDAIEVAADGVSLTVRLGATAHPPMAAWVVPDGVRVGVSSVARLGVSR